MRYNSQTEIGLIKLILRAIASSNMRDAIAFEKNVDDLIDVTGKLH